jgi:hypothetical protein
MIKSVPGDGTRVETSRQAQLLDNSLTRGTPGPAFVPDLNLCRVPGAREPGRCCKPGTLVDDLHKATSAATIECRGEERGGEDLPFSMMIWFLLDSRETCNPMGVPHRMSDMCREVLSQVVKSMASCGCNVRCQAQVAGLT